MSGRMSFKGRWVRVVRQPGNTYHVQVQHFSFWGRLKGAWKYETAFIRKDDAIAYAMRLLDDPDNQVVWSSAMVVSAEL